MFPSFLPRHANIGVVLCGLGDLEGAMAACQIATRLDDSVTLEPGSILSRPVAPHDLPAAIEARI